MRNAEKKRGWLVPLGLVLFLGSGLLSLCVGSLDFSPVRLMALFLGKEDGAAASILWYSRLPRTLACLLAGAALSVSGAVLQSVLSNKLASPGIIGVNAGAGLGVTLCCAAGALSGWAVSGGAFLGSLAAMLIVAFFCGWVSASKTTVILTGVALNSLLNAASEAVTVLDPDVAALNTEFRVGGFSAVTYSRLLPAGALILFSLLVLLTLSSQLDVLALGDETARGLGLAVGRCRMLFLMLAALLAGAAVSFAGLLGFVGLIVPHFVRLLTGSASRRLLTLCILWGGAFVALCDLAARKLFLPFEMPVGILMAVLGGPVFVLLLVKTKGGHRHD